MTDVERDKRVLVTGGTGYLAGWMIVGLLRKGFSVRTTVRELGKQAVVRGAVERLVGPVGDRLSFAKADLLRDEGWAQATSDCRYVMHVASPMGQAEPKGTDLVGPAREGTLRVLKAASASGVERVVYTSSGFVAQSPVVPGGTPPVADEGTWTDPEEHGLGEYARSKILAERAAWDFIRADTTGMTFTTILPGLILGGAMSKIVSPSLQIVARLLTGKVPALPRVGFCMSDVRDLVELHIRAMMNPEAADQRFVGIGDFLWFDEIAQTLKKAFPDRADRIPTKQVPNWVMRVSALFRDEARFMLPMLGVRREYNASKAAMLLQWKPRPSRDAVVACATSLIDQGLV